MSIILWALGILVGVSILFVLGFLFFLTKTEFTPVMNMKLEIKGKGKPLQPSQREFTFLTWNIGYAGLGKEMDFFYDGGKRVRAEKDETSQYFNGIKNAVSAYKSTDFIFIQEIDIHSKRSWYYNEFVALSNVLSDFFYVFAPNYDCRFVPVPLKDPLGRVVSGIASYLRMEPNEAEVHYFNAFFKWPKRLVFLKRCFILLRFGLDNGKDLVILNIHNSAYDSTGVLRKHELTILDSTMKAEYSRGNYVVAGGDWNCNPRDFKISSMVSGDLVSGVDHPIKSDFLPGWQFVFDPSQPSNRNVDAPYQRGITKTTIIDFYIASPNIEIKSVATIPMEFSYSDHQPVLMRIRLK